MRVAPFLMAVAFIAAVLMSGCTQESQTGPGTNQSFNKAAEEKAAAALESELEQAIANISEQDIENALLG